MNLHVILLLAVAFALLVFLLVCVCLHSPLHARWKWALVALATGAYFAGYVGLRDSQGWATAEVLPAKFIFLAVVIEEPVKDKTKGEIFVWVQPLQDNRPSGEPRAHRLPYEKGLHSMLDEANKKTRRGNAQMGSTEPRQGMRSMSWLRPSGNDTLQIRIRDMPANQLPEK